MSSSPEDKQLYVEIWKKAVETQMHFNEMAVKSRQLGLTFVAAALGVAILLLGRGGDYELCFKLHYWLSSNVAPLIIFGAALGMIAVRTLDLNVYHKMLRGAVTFGEDFEENILKKNVFNLEKGMTQAISHFSRHQDAKAVSNDGIYNYKGESKITAEKKIKSFYRYAIIFFCL